ncbi:Uncharacterised protein [Mycobacterium tuberculosis]|uniref:Uncharacterized protein n=1 Tax=Mycobacterium tuberculosis TaxID=1773 RepID=A0A0U0QMY7_MYCTX|nr:Uncharacterised protein [Mycobacterium tuberculosis]COV33849.1 Uncharacterised protein [Mycobacterium tuberculosis]
MRQPRHARDDAPQVQGGRSSRRVHQHRPKKALSVQKERRHAVSARGDNPLVVGADVVVGRRIIQRRVQNRRIDADVAQ